MPTLTIENYHELLALHRLIMAAKFSDFSLEGASYGSPLVASVADRVVTTLMMFDSVREGTAALERWKAWRVLEPSRREWLPSVQRVSECDLWDGWSDDARREYVGYVVAPLLLSSEMMEEFFAQVTSLRGAVPKERTPKA